MNKYVAAYAGAAAVMVVLDMLWLGVIAKPMYQKGLGHLMADKTKLGVGALFYLMYAVGVVVFAVTPQHNGASWGLTLVMGALFGFFAYATYDLTNMATLRDWPLKLSLIDIGWGTGVTAAAAARGQGRDGLGCWSFAINLAMNVRGARACACLSVSAQMAAQRTSTINISPGYASRAQSARTTMPAASRTNQELSHEQRP